MIYVIAAVLLGGLIESAAAAPIIFAFTGNVTHVDPALAGTFNTSQSLWGYYIFESTTPDTDLDPSEGNYVALVELPVIVGSYSATWNGAAGGISVLNGATVDGYEVNATLGGLDVGSFAITLQDSSKTAFSSDALPQAIDLSMFGDVHRWELLFVSSLGFVKGELTSLEEVKQIPLAPVPEPSSAMLLLGIIPILVAVHRSKIRVQR
jgi:hypothetical protein